MNYQNREVSVLTSFHKKTVVIFNLISLIFILSISSKIQSDELTYAGQASKDVSIINSSRAVGDDDVSLYTGQHVEIFPLLSLPTNGLGGVDINLSYSGNVNQAAKEQNRTMPASWVGLGFNLNFEYIYCDHKATVNYYDDEYFFVTSSGESFKLIQEGSGNIFKPSSGELWRLERNTASINGTTYVIGWTVKKENGIKFIYGDQTTDFTSNRNATWYQLSWGPYLLVGVDAADEPFPFRWDLARVERGPNVWVTYEYQQFNDKLQVIAPDSNVTSNFYTKESYPKKIVASSGYAAEFILESRTDYQDFSNGASYEYYNTKRLSKLVSSYNNISTSYIRLTYDYLNDAKSSIWKKSILSSIQTFDRTNTDALPPISFTYYNDTTLKYFGSIQEIYYSEGGKKEIVYDLTSADSTLMSLNEGGRITFAERPKYAYSSSVMIRKYRLDGQSEWHYDVGAFNGYWDMREVPDLTDSKGDSSVTAGDNWVALYNHDLDRIIVFTWNKGAWTRDTIIPEWSVLEQSIAVSSAPGDIEHSTTYTTSTVGYVSYSLSINGPSGDESSQTTKSLPETALAPPSYAKIYLDGILKGEVSGTGAQSTSGQFPVTSNQVVRIEAFAKSTDYSAAQASAGIYQQESPAYDVKLLAGNDFILAFDTKNASPMKLVKRGYYFKKNSNTWNEHFIFNQGHYNDSLASVKLGLDLFAIEIEDQNDQKKSKLIYGKYDHELNSLNVNASVWKDRLIYDVGIDIVTYGGKAESVWETCGNLNGYIHILDYKDNNWNDTAVFVSGLRDLIALQNGVVFTEGWRRLLCGPDQEWGAAIYFLRNATGWKYGYFEIGFDHLHPVSDPLVSSGGMSFALHSDRYGMDNYADDIYIYEWDGNNWHSTPALTNCWHNMSMELTDEMFIAHHLPKDFDETNGQVYAKKRIGSNQWSSTVQLTDEVYNAFYQTGCPIPCSIYPAYIQAAGDMVVVCGDDGWGGKIRDLYTYNDEADTWDTTFLVPYTYDPTIDSSYYAHPYVFNGRIFIRDVGIPTDYTDRGFYCFQKYQDSILGSPQMPVVKQIKVYPEGDATTNPMMTEYSYDGGILDPDANTPRFCRTTKSLPFYQNDQLGPDGFNIYYFYNDLDDDYIEDPHGDGSLLLPDLNDPTFQIENGGYLLAGQVYYSYDSTVTDTAFTLPHDATYYYYSLARINDYLDAGFRIYLDSTQTRIDGINNFKYYKYDTYGRVIETRIPLFDNLTKVSQNTYTDFSSVYNVYDKVSLMTDFIATPTDTQWTRRTKSEWLYNSGDVQLSRSIIWPDATVDLEDGTEIITFQQMTGLPNNGHDTYGNLVSWCGTDFDTLGAKYSPDGTKLTANIKNGFVNNIFLFDAEYDFDANNLSPDGWENMTPALNTITYSDAFTGHKSLKIVDDPQSSSNNIGIQRFLYADSVVRKSYILTFWAKSNGPVRGAIGVLTNSNGRSVNTSIHPGDDQWHLLSCVIELTDAESAELQYLQFGITLEDYSSGYAYIDDVRFQPVDALIETYVYDENNGYKIAKSNNSNLPVRFQRDDFYRFIQKSSFDHQLLSTREYNYSKPLSSLNANAHITDARGTDHEYITITVSQQVSYTLDVTVLGVSEIYGYTNIYCNNTKIDSIVFDGNLDSVKTEVYDVVQNDVIHLEAHAVGPDQGFIAISSRMSYLDEGENGPYQPDRPNYVKTTNFHGDNRNSSSVNYFNGIGETIQRRKQIEKDDQIVTLVSGLLSKNGRGQTLTKYLSYIDLWGDNGLTHYADSSEYVTELNDFYNGINEIDMQGYAYKNSEYEKAVKSRPLVQSKSGPDYSINSNHVTSYEYSPFYQNNDSLLITDKTDPDGIKTRNVSHIRGKYSSKVIYYTKNQLLDSIVSTSMSFPLDQRSIISIDTGTGNILLRESYINDLGTTDSTWKVDCGTKRFYYNKSGYLRFAQDSGQMLNDQFVYYTYDKLGRKVAEGILSSASTKMTQENAYDNLFPYAIDSPIVSYRWYYDIYSSQDTINPFNSLNPFTIYTPGSLVRVESGNGSYYKNYYYFPEQRKDIIITKLPLSSSTLKAVVHHYNLDGSVKKLEVFPHFPDSIDARGFSYEYDINGMLKSINEAMIGPDGELVYSRKYAKYEYKGSNKIKTMYYGVYNNDLLDSTAILQKVDYTYDTRGLLTKINDPDLAPSNGGIVPYLEGAVTPTNENDHFGMKISYNEDQLGYFNGRIFKTTSVNSHSVTETKTHIYQYNYNELGWLTEANHLNDNTYSQHFSYNALGNRDTMCFVGLADTTIYQYDLNGHDGSSKLLRTSKMGTAPDITYDFDGNMVADSSRIIYKIIYDYRNLITYSLVNRSASGLPYSNLNFSYDETGKRIKKGYKYWYWTNCEPEEIEKIASSTTTDGTKNEQIASSESSIFNETTTTSTTSSSGSSSSSTGPGGYSCPKAAYNDTYYLYDGAVLLATFDRYDNVKDLYVNGVEGLVASYENNDNNKLYYYLKDNLGSIRVVLHDRVNNSPIVAQYNSYYPYGEILESWGSVNSNFKYTGKEYDNNSTFNFAYYGSRYYDYKLGRFSSLDEAGEFVNGYSYVGNNPISHIDPDGNSISGLIAFGIKIWTYYQTAKSAYQVGQGLYAFGKNPSVAGFAQLASSFGEGYILSKVGNSPKGIGIKVAWNRAANNRWPTTDEYITYGLHLAYSGAKYYENRKKEAESTTTPSKDKNNNQSSGGPVYASLDNSVYFASSYASEEYVQWWIDDDGIWWYEDGVIPEGEGCEYLCEDEDLIDSEGNLIDPADENYHIPNGTKLLLEMAKHFSSWKYKSLFLALHIGDPKAKYALFAYMAWNTDPFVGLNLKGMKNTIFYGFDQHTYFEGGWLLTNEAWGNIMFGEIAREYWFTMFEAKAGAGAAQIIDGTARWEWHKTYFDDPRDQFFIEIGYNNVIPLK